MAKTILEARTSCVAYRDGDVVLLDGSTVRVRPLRAEHEVKLFELLLSLSEEDRLC